MTFSMFGEPDCERAFRADERAIRKLFPRMDSKRRWPESPNGGSVTPLTETEFRGPPSPFLANCRSCDEIPSIPDHASSDVRVSLKAKSESEADEHVVDVDLGKLSVEHRLIDDA